MEHVYTTRDFDIVFGVQSLGDTPEQRAETSSQVFVRSQDGLAFEKEDATGLRMSAVVALKTFGMQTLLEICDKGSAIIVIDEHEPSGSIIRRREALGITQEQLAEKSGISLEAVATAENSGTCSPMQVLIALSEVLGLDPLRLSFGRDPIVV